LKPRQNYGIVAVQRIVIVSAASFFGLSASRRDEVSFAAAG
jgi:hypothetical protein